MRPSLTKPIHIYFDSNIRGTLEAWYSTLEKTQENITVLDLHDNLAIGPLVPQDQAFLQALTTLPPDRPCYVWASDSPHERIGVALAGACLAPQRDTFFLCDSAALVQHFEVKDWGARDVLMAQAPVAETKFWAVRGIPSFRRSL